MKKTMKIDDEGKEGADDKGEDEQEEKEGDEEEVPKSHEVGQGRRAVIKKG